jgi:hypothetical protein
MTFDTVTTKVDGNKTKGVRLLSCKTKTEKPSPFCPANL